MLDTKIHNAELLALFRPSRFGSPLAGRKKQIVTLKSNPDLPS